MARIKLPAGAAAFIVWGSDGLVYTVCVLKSDSVITDVYFDRITTCFSTDYLCRTPAEASLLDALGSGKVYNPTTKRYRMLRIKDLCDNPTLARRLTKYRT